ncbi:ARIH1 [Bugula neritina]|uniref:RBR-type E3 ubiquitin transferase n=1 Tax=Bugula neritina TaxID=10212 RepID=A0A7J7KNR8_BUGNE|nr:ARIH1 [Bugula neritina]
MDSEEEMYDESEEEEVSDDDHNMVMEPEVSSTTATYDSQDETYPHEVLSPEMIVQHMIDCIKDVNTIVELPATITRILLNHFKWDKEKLIEKYYDGDQEKLFAEAHIISPSRRGQASGSSNQVSVSSTTRSTRSRAAATGRSADCEICFSTLPTTVMTGLECGHLFCEQCWSMYLTSKILHEGISETISCPAHVCGILVDDATVMRLVRDQRVRLKYQHLITNSFVECNRLLRWCPAADCGRAIRVNYVDSKPVTCTCGHRFCFSCAESWHDPVKCFWLKKWVKKCDDDSETSNWIAANTKECPKCQVTIEKDGGCNHMICRNQSCKADFCWVCLGPWEPHGSSWAALQRYLHYCNRYMNHMQSLKFEHKLYAKIKAKMEEMQKHNMSWIEVQFLKKAVDVLCQCRQTLMFTYVFAFYLKKNNQSIIFEDNQRDLEQATEQLSEYLERDITSDILIDIKQKVQDKFRYCDTRRSVLLAHVHEGYEKELWEYQGSL